jgi:Tfp pilus assembly protein PilF
VAATLHNLGYLHSRDNRNEEARGEYEESLKIRRELAQKNPDIFLPDVATTLCNIGSLDLSLNRTSQARRSLEEALQIYQGFADKNPARFQPLVDRRQRSLSELPH